MTNREMKKTRNSTHYESQRQCWDAFMLPIERLNLPAEDQLLYAREAKKAAEHLVWDTYDSTRSSFRDHCSRLIQEFGKKLPNQEAKQVKEEMYIRFMEGRVYSAQYREKQEAFQGEPIPVGDEDFHNVDMALLFAHLPPQPEIAKYLEGLDVSWTYDQLHMVTWFSGQLSLGEGDYSRSRPNYSARKTYERLLNPYSLLWIAAALGENQAVVQNAGREMRDYATYRAKCGVIRRAIPWKRIYELALIVKETQSENN